ncbi:hypothetical protein A3A40_00730 [Candidatus Kaiserbacteria bacterium RIFCSPLOWO2_01_FULL_54_20]|uniref:Uncharacterized protein n=1 Tax=Candidatus Kaiserbacteria bacterium RIFCSPLOWO2_01_FULL_54_20 TaxID=1798513 RepID=A0A1F6EJK0_9BACT|nr:MAG: hypothetical protein A3A40_00730 [Candidatus Kaiserbacteria bacterium RIFCSPLOWO2_01_FULL_54_20]
MAQSNEKHGKPQTIVIVYPRNTIEITMSQECAEQLLASAIKRDALTDSCEFTGEDVNGQKFRVEVRGSAQAVYARSHHLDNQKVLSALERAASQAASELRQDFASRVITTLSSVAQELGLETETLESRRP